MNLEHLMKFHESATFNDVSWNLEQFNDVLWILQHLIFPVAHVIWYCFNSTFPILSYFIETMQIDITKGLHSIYYTIKVFSWPCLENEEIVTILEFQFLTFLMKNNIELWSSPKCSLLHSAHSFKINWKREKNCQNWD